MSSSLFQVGCPFGEVLHGPYSLKRHGGLLQLQVQLHTIASSLGIDGIGMD
jgi:hypothetical protein